MIRSMLLSLLIGAACFGSEADGIRLPTAIPSPAPITAIGERQIYVIDSDAELIVLTSPNSVLKVTKDEGPLRIKAEFADDPGKIYTRLFTGKFIYSVEALADGQSELIIVPVGVKAESEILRRILTTTLAPRPPTPPINPPQPPPENPAPPAPPIPTPFGLESAVKASAKNIPAAKRVFAVKLAEAYKDGAKKLADPNSGWTTANAASKQRDVNRAIPGYEEAVWAPVFTAVADTLGVARAAGKFSTQQHYVAAWAELSMAFAGVAQ